MQKLQLHCGCMPLPTNAVSGYIFLHTFVPDSYKGHCNLDLWQLKHNHFIFESKSHCARCNEIPNGQCERIPSRCFRDIAFTRWNICFVRSQWPLSKFYSGYSWLQMIFGPDVMKFPLGIPDIYLVNNDARSCNNILWHSLKVILKGPYFGI